MRDGAELIRATKPFAVDNRTKTWGLFAVTVGVILAMGVTAAWPTLPLGLRIAAAVLQGLTTVRLFIFFHDWLHGAIWVRSKPGAFVMHLSGLYFLTPASIWRESHNYHHKNNTKMVGSGIGSYPWVTTSMWRRMKPGQRFVYRAIRHPLNMLFGYVTLFGLGMCIKPFVDNPKKHWVGPLALILHVLGLYVLWQWGGVLSAVLGLMAPVWLATAAGSYLFYAQHNFPGVELKDRGSWDYVHAALKCSSMFDMSAVMHWFTGNIGYHHVHHLNHRIPFYNLPKAMAELPELQSPYRTSWKPSDVAAALDLDVWDPRAGEMISLDEAGQRAPSAA